MMFLMGLLMVSSAPAYESGGAPFCIMDNYGNTQCFYYDMMSCRAQLQYAGQGATCVKK